MGQSLVWKAWVTPKVKFFSSLTIHNRIWTALRIEKRGWNNCGLCPLYKQIQESAAYLFSHCRLSKRLWEMVKIWFGMANIQTKDWMSELSIDEWWTSMTCFPKPNCKCNRLSNHVCELDYFFLEKGCFHYSMSNYIQPLHN
jgi:hypothetical protein